MRSMAMMRVRARRSAKKSKRFVKKKRVHTVSWKKMNKERLGRVGAEALEKNDGLL